MSFVVGILMFILVLICVFLILLVLVQLPKKDAGAGMAFGGGTADALFGAGSGNALTKITKWTAVVFLVLALGLGWLQNFVSANNSASSFTKMVEQKQQQQTIPAPSSAPAKPQSTPPAASGLLSTTIPMAPTNAEAPVSTNKAK